MNLLTWKTRTAACLAAVAMCIGLFGAQALLVDDYTAVPAEMA
jgi:hypothetical protein